MERMFQGNKATERSIRSDPTGRLRLTRELRPRLLLHRHEVSVTLAKVQRMAALIIDWLGSQDLHGRPGMVAGAIANERLELSVTQCILTE